MELCELQRRVLHKKIVQLSTKSHDIVMILDTAI